MKKALATVEICVLCDWSSDVCSSDLNTGGHSTRVLNERSVSDGGNLCPLWLEILKSL